MEEVIGRVVLDEALGSEFLKEVFASVLLQGLRKIRNPSSGCNGKRLPPCDGKWQTGDVGNRIGSDLRHRENPSDNS